MPDFSTLCRRQRHLAVHIPYPRLPHGIAQRAAAAVIPPRKNGKPWKEQTAETTIRNDALRSCCRLGRAISKRWTDYHRRSLVEAKMRCFKLLSERVMSHDFERQVAEL